MSGKRQGRGNGRRDLLFVENIHAPLRQVIGIDIKGRRQLGNFLEINQLFDEWHMCTQTEALTAEITRTEALPTVAASLPPGGSVCCYCCAPAPAAQTDCSPTNRDIRLRPNRAY